MFMNVKKCLIVDDSAFDRKAIEYCLSKAGLFSIVTSSGQEALAICNKSLPDCVILDWEMKEMNGIEFLKLFHKMKGGQDIPVIICTSHEHSSFVGHAYLNGANGYITKPITQDNLKNELAKVGILTPPL